LLSGAGWLVGWIVDYEVIYLDSQVVSYWLVNQSVRPYYWIINYVLMVILKNVK
jgi:hypothetical protein